MGLGKSWGQIGPEWGQTERKKEKTRHLVLGCRTLPLLSRALVRQAWHWRLAPSPACQGNLLPHMTLFMYKGQREEAAAIHVGRNPLEAVRIRKRNSDHDQLPHWGSGSSISDTQVGNPGQPLRVGASVREGSLPAVPSTQNSTPSFSFL